MSAAGPGASGARRRPRRDTPRAARPRAAVAPATVAQAEAPRAPRLPRPARRWRLWLAAGMAVLVLAGAAVWVLLGSSLLDARSVQVAGATELPADAVRAAAAVPLGTPMLLLDTTAIEARVAAVPRVASVHVRCTLDGTVRIELTERTPVAVVRRPNGAHLVDATGTDYATVPAGPAGLPELRVARAGPQDGATMAALTVLTGLPEWLRAQITRIDAKSPADIVLHLSSGREVRWGGVEDGGRKAAVLAPLLTQPGKIYDVSSPALPTIA